MFISRDEKVRSKILRIFKIWEQRSVYDDEFLSDLTGLLSAGAIKKTDDDPLDFQVRHLFWLFYMQMNQNLKFTNNINGRSLLPNLSDPVLYVHLMVMGMSIYFVQSLSISCEAILLCNI